MEEKVPAAREEQLIVKIFACNSIDPLKNILLFV